MATAAVKHFVDEGVSPDETQQEVFVDEGTSIDPVRQPQRLNSLEAYERAGKQWDMSMKHNVPLVTLNNYWEDFDNDTQITKEPPIGFIESMAEANLIAESVPFVSSVYQVDRMSKLIYATRRLNNPDLYIEDAKASVQETRTRFALGPIAAGVPIMGLQTRDPEDLKEVDIALLSEWIIELDKQQSRGFTIGGKIAEGIRQLPAFMGEFLLTGPFFRSASGVARKAGERVLGRLVQRGVGKYALKAAAAGFGTLARTGVNVPRVLAGAAQQMSPDIQITPEGAMVFTEATTSPYSALARSFGDLYIENLTEVSGKAIGEVAGAIPKLVGGKLAKQFPKLASYTDELAKAWLSKNPSKTISQFLRVTSTKLGYDGILEEMGEERLGAVLRAATGLGEWDDVVPSYEDLLVEAGIFSVLPIGTLIGRQARRRKKGVPSGQPVIMEGVVLRQALGEPVTTEDLIRNPTIWISLFESEKNIELSEEQKEVALEFINERIGEKPIVEERRTQVIAKLPDDFEDFVEGLEAAAGMLQPPTVAKPRVQNMAKPEGGFISVETGKPFRSRVFRGEIEGGISPEDTGIPGIYFTTFKETAKTFAEDFVKEQQKGVLLEGIIELQNPLNLSSQTMEDLGNRLVPDTEGMSVVEIRVAKDKAIRKDVEGRGHDGIVIEDGSEIIIFNRKSFIAQPPTEAKPAPTEAAIRDEWSVINQYLVEHDPTKGKVPAQKPYLSIRDEKFAELVNAGKESGRESALYPGRLEHAEDAIRIGERLGYRPDDIAAYLQKNYIDQPPVEIEAPEPPVDIEAQMQKLKEKAVKDIGEAKQPRRLIEREKTVELGKRAVRSARAAEQAAGEQRLNAALGQLKGPLTDYKRPDFTPLKETWSQAEIDALHDDIWVNPHSPDHFDKLSTAKAWSKITEGFVPTRGEILLIEKQWGKGWARALLKKRPFGDRAWDSAADISNFMRTMLVGGDVSVAGRQLRVLGQAYPKEWGKAVVKGLGAYKSEKLADLMRKDYTASVFHKEAKKYVQFFDPAGTVTTPPSERPEWYMSQYPEQVPILGHLIRMGNRNYVETMNMFTQSVWDKVRAQDLRNGIEPTEEQFALRGKWLMSMTGRPEIGGVVGKRLAPIAAGFFFAPRFAVSRFTSPLYIRHLASGDPVAREVGRNTAIAFSAFIGTNIAVIALLKLAYGDDVEVELDPRSPDWGKIRIGNSRHDLWAGHQQAARFMVQMALGEYKTQTGKIKETERFEIIGRFIRGKENPLVALISDLYKGKTYVGDRPFSPPEGEWGRISDELQIPELIQGIGKEAYRRMFFMWVQDFLDATANDGWLMGFTAGTLSFFGFNTQSYEDTVFTKIAKFKDTIAQTEHARDWNDLNASQQTRLSRIHKQLFAEMRLQAKIEGARRDDYDYVGRLIEDEKKAGKKVYKKLVPANRKLLDEAGISLGLSRKIGDWEINDERYEQYQEITAELLDAKLSKLAEITGWASLPNTRKIIKIELAVQIAKDKAKSQVRREAKRIQ